MRAEDQETVRAALWRWYRHQAGRLFAARLSELAGRLPWLADDPPLRLRRMRRRWGSCSASGVITLNTHLVKAPTALLDYVILHELCHLRELNHGPRFYELMDQALPDWRARRQDLDTRAHHIGNE